MRSRRLSFVVLSATLAGLTACSSSAANDSLSPPALSIPTGTPNSAASGSVASATATARPSDLGTVPPSTRSALPDGVYRTQINQRWLQQQHYYDNSMAGTWTLTVKDGTYQLQCQSDIDPTVNCGHDGVAGRVTVEIGTLRGTGSTVWFVHDLAATTRLCGTTNGRPTCHIGGYRLTWTTTAHGVVFSDFVGLADEAGGKPDNNWTLQPWIRIS